MKAISILSTLKIITKTFIQVTAILIGLQLSCFAQVNPVDISGTSTVYSACQGVSYKLYFDSNYYGYRPMPDYYYDKCPGDWNNYGHYSTEENNTLKIKGDGIDAQINSEGSGIQKKYFADVKFTKSSSYTIIWSNREHYPAGCSTTLRENAYTATYKKVIFIPTPPKPTLTALKAVVKFPESTTITSTSCPNTLAGNTEYYLYPNNSAFFNWSYKCANNGEPDYVKKLWYEPFSLPFTAGENYYQSATVFRARCDDNGCLSEVSDPVAVGVQYSAPYCDDAMMAQIDSYTRDGRPDYHHYTVETAICNKDDGNPNCSKEKVFELIKSSKALSAPVASDFAETLINRDLGNLDAKVPLIGSNLIYPVNNTKVEDCTIVNLFSYMGAAFNLVALRFGARSYMFARKASTLKPIANPIAQVIDDASLSVTNYTKEGHILYKGKITRIVIEDCNQVKLITIGSGHNWLYDLGAYDSAVRLTEKNVEAGKIIFHNADQRVINQFNKLPR